MSSDNVHVTGADIKARIRLFNESIKTKSLETEVTTKTPFNRKIVWKNVVVYVIGHVLGLWGLYLSLFRFPLYHTVISVMFGYFTILIGIQVGAHRFYSHRSYKASKGMQVVIMLFQTICSQNCIWVWVRDHRQHHKYSDTDADPHNASNGFFFSHVGWLLSRKHPDVIAKGKGIDMSDLDADPIVQFQKRYYTVLWIVLAFLLPLTIPLYFYGYSFWESVLTMGALRICIMLNMTWLTNSWAHRFGSKPFDKNIRPVECAFISWALVGEGWHNYHHTFPWDYNTSEIGEPFNLAGHIIRFCARHGYAWDLKQANEEMIYARAEKTGDGTPYTTKLKFNSDNKKIENNNNA